MTLSSFQITVVSDFVKLMFLTLCIGCIFFMIYNNYHQQGYGSDIRLLISKSYCTGMCMRKLLVKRPENYTPSAHYTKCTISVNRENLTRRIILPLLTFLEIVQSAIFLFAFGFIARSGYS